ncbi:MAG: ribose 5-phosphate isomerase A [Nitrososphaerales archaeon]
MSSGLDSAFERMAKSAARNLVRSSEILGLGSGSAVARFAKALGERVKKDSIEITVVPSSLQSWLLVKVNGLTIAEDSAHCPAIIDVAVDGADQISLSSRSMIKGGGGALLKEKIIISSATKCYILADDSKYVPNLNRSVPVEVIQFSLLAVEHKIRNQLGAEPSLRKLDKGYPFFTESGNVVLDCQFKEGISDPSKVESQIKSIPGVVEAGIFNSKVDRFYKANQDGTFETL